jgi:hypothetical protein
MRRGRSSSTNREYGFQLRISLRLFERSVFVYSIFIALLLSHLAYAETWMRATGHGRLAVVAGFSLSILSGDDCGVSPLVFGRDDPLAAL